MDNYRIGNRVYQSSGFAKLKYRTAVLIIYALVNNLRVLYNRLPFKITLHVSVCFNLVHLELTDV